jgi:hypothetical protein
MSGGDLGDLPNAWKLHVKMTAKSGGRLNVECGVVACFSSAGLCGVNAAANGYGILHQGTSYRALGSDTRQHSSVPTGSVASVIEAGVIERPSNGPHPEPSSTAYVYFSTSVPWAGVRPCSSQSGTLAT